MNAYAWIVLAWLTGCALLWIYRIGKPRPVITGTAGVIGVIEYAVAGWLIVMAVLS